MITVWDKLDEHWSPLVNGRRTKLASLREEMRQFLQARDVAPVAFSHFGVVVTNIDATLAALADVTGVALRLARRDWVESYKVHVARGMLDRVELELIEPAGESFFSEALHCWGEGVQHLSFQVAGIQSCLDRLRAGTVELIDEVPRVGSHGRVAFAKPAEFAPIYLELCEPD